MPGRRPPRNSSLSLREDPAAFANRSGLREIAASEAKTHFARLLEAVERGETIAITRHGRRIARIVPDADRKQQEIREAFERLDKIGTEIRAQHGSMTLEEILSLRHEGHKY